MNRLIFVMLTLFVTTASAQLQTEYDNNGLKRLGYNGVFVYDSTRDWGHPLRMGSITFEKGDGTKQNTYLEDKGTRTFDASTKTLTIDYTRWVPFKFVVQYIEGPNEVKMVWNLHNLSPDKIVYYTVNWKTFVFPEKPAGWTEHMTYGDNPEMKAPFVLAEYGNQRFAWVSDEVRLPIAMQINARPPGNAGWFYFTMQIPAGPKNKLHPNPWYTAADLPIAGNSVRTHTVSLRFAPRDQERYQIVKDVLDRYRELRPMKLNWPDRRPIGMVFIANGANRTSTNPRTFLGDGSINVFTPEGKADFKRRMLQAGDTAVNELKRMGAQGGIVWNIEGEEYPHAITYIGDPTILAERAPEMDEIADEYMAKFTAAGLKIGLCIRPQKFEIKSDGWAYQTGLEDDELIYEHLLKKVRYAKQRWGVTIFYVDSNVYEGGGAINVNIFRRLLEQEPDVLFIPEWEITAYWAYTFPYGELDMGVTRTWVEPRAHYPQTATVLNLTDGDFNTPRAELVNSFAVGDILMFRGWFQDGINNSLKAISDEGRAQEKLPPLPQFIDLKDGAVLSKRSIVRALASDESPLSSFSLLVDGEMLQQSATSPESFVLPTRRFGNGTRRLTLRAQDSKGNIGEASIKVLLENTPAAPLAPSGVSIEP